MKYEKIDIEVTRPHLSTDLASLVIGRHVFYDMTDHQMRVNRIKALIVLLEAVKELGDFEHTGDWDWRIEIMHAPGSEMGKTTPGEDNGFSDTMVLPELEPGDYTSNLDRVENVELEVWSYEGSDGATMVPVPIDDIRSISIWYDT